MYSYLIFLKGFSHLLKSQIHQDTGSSFTVCVFHLWLIMSTCRRKLLFRPTREWLNLLTQGGAVETQSAHAAWSSRDWICSRSVEQSRLNILTQRGAVETQSAHPGKSSRDAIFSRSVEQSRHNLLTQRGAVETQSAHAAWSSRDSICSPSEEQSRLNLLTQRGAVETQSAHAAWSSRDSIFCLVSGLYVYVYGVQLMHIAHV